METRDGSRMARPARVDVSCRMCGTRGLEEVGAVDGYAFVECPACGLVFAPELTPARMQELYASGHHGHEDGAPDEGWATNEATFLDPAFRLLGPGPLHILDFGTGQSHVPDHLRERGHRVIAVDVAPPRRPHTDRLTGSLADLALPEGPFDLAFAYQVMEHIPEPRPVLDRLLALVRPGGLVLVHTDMETPERDAGGFTAWWYVLPPDHCIFYRQRTFDVYVADAPADVVWRDEKTVILKRRGEGGAGPRGPA